MAHETQQKQMVLPIIIFGAIEVRRLLRELESLEGYLQQEHIREPGKQQSLPRLSRLCESLAGDNGLNLLHAEHRQHMSTFLQQILDNAPVIHMSFASDPSAAFTAKIVTWLRANIHPYALLQVGLQPTIGAGFILRTPNKLFDFSLRNRFTERKSVLITELEGGKRA